MPNEMKRLLWSSETTLIGDTVKTSHCKVLSFTVSFPCSGTREREPEEFNKQWNLEEFHLR